MALDQCDWPYSSIDPSFSQETWHVVGDTLLAYSRMLIKQRSDDGIFHLKNELGTNGGNSSHFNAQHGDEGIENQLKDPKWHLPAFLS